MTAILTATALLLVETFRSPPLASCRTRLLRAWPRAFIWARHCPPPSRPPNAHSDVGCVVFSVAVNVLCYVAVCVPHPPFSSGLGAGNGGVGNIILVIILTQIKSCEALYPHSIRGTRCVHSAVHMRRILWQARTWEAYVSHFVIGICLYIYILNIIDIRPFFHNKNVNLC